MAERQIDSPIIFFIDNLGDKIEYTLSKFVDHNKLEESQIQQKEEPPYRETSTCWKTKPTRTACELIKINIPSCTWDGITPHGNNSWGLTAVVCSSAEEDQRLNLASYPRVAAMKRNH